MNIVFVCLGNICRSPMAEYLAKEIVSKRNLNNITISSCGTASYHQGEFMHHGTDKKLNELNIKHNDFRSRPINQKIFDDADYIVVMDNSNYDDVINRFGKDNKVVKITTYSNLGYNEVPDPWYTNNFDETHKVLSNALNNFFDDVIINKY